MVDKCRSDCGNIQSVLDVNREILMKTSDIKNLGNAYRSIYEVKTKEEVSDNKDFKPHMMYDPETGKGYKAEKPEDHERMKKLGYTHDEPTMVKEKKLPRQMLDPKKDVMVVKNNKVLVVDKSKEKEYLKKGWGLAEQADDVDERMKFGKRLKVGDIVYTADGGKYIKGKITKIIGKHDRDSGTFEVKLKSGKVVKRNLDQMAADDDIMEATLGGTNAPSGETYMGDKGIQKMVALSKKNPNIKYTVMSDNYGEFKPHWLKNGKFAKRTVANINFDMDKNAVRGVPKGKTVKSTIFVLRYSVNEGVQMENVKISFHSKGAKTKWMKKQGVASKEIINQTPTSIELPSRWKDLSKKKDHDEIFSVVMENDEYDNEGGMALSQLRTAKSAVEDLMSSIKEMDNLPEWVQSKLTKAVDYMDSVRDYMASEEGEEPVNEINDARNAELKRQAKAKVKKSKLDLVSKQKKQAIDRLKSQKRTAKMGGDIAKDSEEMKRLNKTYADKVQKIMQEENVDEASAYADARRAFKRDDKRGLASLKRDTDDSATDSDKKAANKNIIMQIRRAADLPNGAEVEFKNGKGKVDRRTAQQVLVKFNSLKKSFEKDKFQKSIRSLSDVKKMIGR